MNIYQSDHTQKPLIFELIRNHENEAAKLHLTSEIGDLYTDEEQKILFISTTSELKFLSLL